MVVVIAESVWIIDLFITGQISALLLPSIFGTVILLGLISWAIKWNAKLTTRILIFTAVAYTAMSTCPVVLGSGCYIFNISAPIPPVAGTISAILYSTFILSLLGKLVIQHYALRLASSTNQLPPAMQHRFKKSYIGYWIGTVATATGLIPVLHLLTVWVAVPIGLALGKSYADRKFYEELAPYLPNSKFPIRSLVLASKIYIATVSFMLPALLLGLSALNI